MANITITYTSGAFFQPPESTVMTGMRARFQNGQIISVTRALGSGRYAITFTPDTWHSTSYWTDVFSSIWYDMGYTGASFVSIEGGDVSSQAGGLQQIGSSVQSFAQNSFLKLALGAVIVIIIIVLFRKAVKI